MLHIVELYMKVNSVTPNLWPRLLVQTKMPEGDVLRDVRGGGGRMKGECVEGESWGAGGVEGCAGRFTA